MIPITLSLWLIAAFPIIFLFICLLILRIPLVKASAISVLLAFVASLLFFQAPLDLLNGEMAKGIWNSFSILIVIFPALLMYEVSCSINAFQSIQSAISRLIPDKLLQVITIGWCFTAFLQGPSGFGVPIAVVAPLLIGIGVRAVWAVIIPLIAQSWGSTFGTLALAWQALVEQTDLINQVNSPLYFETALWSAILIGILCFSSGFVICFFYGSWRAVKHGAIAVTILGGIQALGQIVLSQISPTLCAFIPATLALICSFFIAKLPQYSHNKVVPSRILQENEPQQTEKKDAEKTQDVHITHAVIPYVLLVVISLGILLNPFAYDFFKDFQLSFAFPEVSTGYGIMIPATDNYAPLTIFLHSGFFILLATLVSIPVYMSKSLLNNAELKLIIKKTLVKSIPASLAVMFLIVLSKIMNGSGAIYVLAQGTANIAGSSYSFFAPLIGGIGGFMSGSNVSSNILFAQFQEAIAKILQNNEAVILAAQTSGAAAGALIDPAKVLLGTTTANIAGKEGEVLRKLLNYFLVISFIMGVIVLIFA